MHTPYYPLDLLKSCVGCFSIMKASIYIVNHQQMAEIIKPFQGNFQEVC